MLITEGRLYVQGHVHVQIKFESSRQLLFNVTSTEGVSIRDQERTGHY